MGNSQPSKPIPEVPNTTVITDQSNTSSPPSGYFGVRLVDENLQTEKYAADVKAAYEQGKLDAQQQFQRDLSKVAASVYENVGEQIQDIQNTEREKASALAKSVKQKLGTTQELHNYCSAERSLLVKCLNSYSSNPLQCKDVMDTFTKCVDSTCSTTN